MPYPDPTQYEDQLLQMYGYDPQALPDPYQQQGFQGSRFLEGLSGLEGMQHPTPHSFGEGLLYGLSSGLGAAGTKLAQQRAKFETAQVHRQAEVDAERRRISEENRKSREQAGQSFRTEQAGQRKEKAKFEQDNPPLTESDLAANPQLAKAGYKVGDPFSRTARERMAAPENPAAAARDARAAAAAERSAAALQLQADNAKINNINKLSDDARADPDIKEFPAIRDAYRTGNEAAGRGNSAGDIILMRTIAKATDPTTGVREEEFRTFEGAQGTLARYGVRLTKGMWGAGQLTDAGRQELRSVLQGIYDRKSDAFGRAFDYHSSRAQRMGFSPQDVVRDYRINPPAPGGGRPPLGSFWKP